MTNSSCPYVLCGEHLNCLVACHSNALVYIWRPSRNPKFCQSTFRKLQSSDRQLANLILSDYLIAAYKALVSKVLTSVTFIVMDSATKANSATSSAFQVYLRLRPPPSPLVQLTQQSLYPTLPSPERWLTVEPPLRPTSSDGEYASGESGPTATHITLNPPSDSRKRAVEKFAFTKVFEEQAEQIDVFKGTGIIQLVDGVLGECRDGLVATLGVTGSGKVIEERLVVQQLWNDNADFT